MFDVFDVVCLPFPSLSLVPRSPPCKARAPAPPALPPHPSLHATPRPPVSTFLPPGGLSPPSVRRSAFVVGLFLDARTTFIPRNSNFPDISAAAISGITRSILCSASSCGVQEGRGGGAVAGEGTTPKDFGDDNNMKHGLALIPDLASATRYAAICAGSAQAAKAAVSLKRGSQGYLATASELDEALASMKISNNNTIVKKKVYSPQPEPLVSVFRPRTLLVVLGRNFMSGLVPWMNELQDNINEAAEESAGEGSDDGEEEMMDVEVPPFRPVMAKAARGSVRDYAVLLLKRGMEIFASAFLEPHAACKLLKDHHASARRKRLRYFFDHRQPLRLRVQVGLYRVKRSSQTAAKSALLGFLAELCVNEVLVIYRTVQVRGSAVCGALLPAHSPRNDLSLSSFFVFGADASFSQISQLPPHSSRGMRTARTRTPSRRTRASGSRTPWNTSSGRLRPTSPGSPAGSSLPRLALALDL